MNFLDKMERKFGKYAISNISLYLICCYAVGYLLMFINTGLLSLLRLDPYLILHGQIWRLVTWILVPPSEFSLFTLITLYFYYSIGSSLERTWGTFYYNAYLIMGMLFTLLGSFLLYGLYFLTGGEIGVFQTVMGTVALGASDFSTYIGAHFSTYYVNMSIFLGFAATFPDVQVLLMFIIPIKVKWMGIIYGIMMVYNFFMTDLIGKVVIAVSLLNFGVFFGMTRGIVRLSPKQVKRRHQFKKEIKHAQPKGITRHKCAICGRTEETNPELEFRFCSKCNGNYEYCQEHLFTHTHVK